MVLADLGADVIKVERIDGGDNARNMGPHLGSWGAYYVPINRGKRSIAIDITKPEGREIVLRLASKSDVFIENFRGGKAEALGLDEASVRARKPDIIYASLAAYGKTGPDYRKPGYDAVLQARTGIVSVTGPNADTPIRAGVSILDVGAGVWLALGITTALLERERSGRGQRVDASLFETGVMLMCYHLLYQQFTGKSPGPEGSRHNAMAPYGAFSTTDGAIMIGISTDALFRRLCAALDRADWIADPRFATNASRVVNRAALEGPIAELVCSKPSAHWLELFNRHDVPADAVQNAGEVLADPQLAAIDQLAQIELEGAGAVKIPRLPVRLSLTPAEIAGPPPKLAEHTRAVLAEAGYSDIDIDGFARAGICALGA